MFCPVLLCADGGPPGFLGEAPVISLIKDTQYELSLGQIISIDMEETLLGSL